MKVATLRKLPTPIAEDSSADTGGMISSIAALENAEKLEPHLIDFIRQVSNHERVTEAAKKRLQALLVRHA